MDLVPYIKAAYPVLYLLTAEESRAEMMILDAAKTCSRKLKIWSITDGIFTPAAKGKGECDQIEDPIAALTYLRKEENLPAKTLVVCRDLHMFFNHPKTIRLVRDIAREFKQQQKTLIIISPVNKIPPELERDITLIEFALPDHEELGKGFDALCKANKIEGKIEADERERIIEAATGLTTDEAEAAFAKAIVEHSNGKNDINVSRLVMNEKANTVKKSGILEYFEASETVKDIGGLDNLKKWLDIRSKSFTKKAKEFGLPMPRGILLVGPPGCGKSLASKATSNILGVPLIRFDIGRVFGSLVGSSEANMRTAINTVEAIGNCVLFIDEMDKAFAGMGSSGNTDGGTGHRVFGNFITWLQDKTVPAFVVATINRINLPPELLRKGRFDEIFFIGLPSEKERKEILEIHIKKYGRKPEDFDLKPSVDASEGFSGAELEEAIISGLYMAFHHNRDLESDDIEQAIRNTNPLSKSKAEQLEDMAKWAMENAVNASAIKGKGKSKQSAGRQLDL